MKSSESWAIITGATAGIGLATAELLAKSGWNIVITGRRQDRLENLKSKIEKEHKVSVITAAFDIQKRSEIEKFVKSLKDKKIEALINNAGLARGREPIHECNLDDVDEMVDTNIKGLIYITRLVLPKMIEQNSGHIINLGSVAGKWVYPSGNTYCATKFAVRALTEGIRMDLYGKNIRVTNIEPGVVETEFTEVRFRNKEAAKNVYKGFMPLQAIDIAETILWCLSRPGHVNIQELVVFPTAQAAIAMVSRN